MRVKLAGSIYRIVACSIREKRAEHLNVVVVANPPPQGQCGGASCGYYNVADEGVGGVVECQVTSQTSPLTSLMPTAVRRSDCSVGGVVGVSVMIASTAPALTRRS